jgi:lactoylglutathione lyase
MPRTLGLAHVNLNVSDIDRSVRFYTEVFGLELLSDGTETIQREGQPVELRQALLSTPGRQDLLALSHAASFPIGNAGLNHIGFNFESDEDVRTAIEAVPRHGGKIVKEGEREEGGVREVFAYVQDPDGYYVEMSTQAIVFSASRARQGLE